MEPDDSAWAHNTGNGGLPGADRRTSSSGLKGPDGRWGEYDSPPTDRAQDTDGSHKASFTQKLHGEADVVVGKLTHNQHLIEEGEALKRGS
jgi:hypothetical protein